MSRVPKDRLVGYDDKPCPRCHSLLRGFHQYMTHYEECITCGLLYSQRVWYVDSGDVLTEYTYEQHIQDEHYGWKPE